MKPFTITVHNFDIGFYAVAWGFAPISATALNYRYHPECGGEVRWYVINRRQ